MHSAAIHEIEKHSMQVDRVWHHRVIDEGELDLEKNGGKSTDFRASWRTYNKTEYDQSFTPSRSMRH